MYLITVSLSKSKLLTQEHFVTMIEEKNHFEILWNGVTMFCVYDDVILLFPSTKLKRCVTVCTY